MGERAQRHQDVGQAETIETVLQPLLARQIDARLKRPGQQGRGHADSRHDDRGKPPAHRFDQRRDGETAEHPAERHAGLLDRKNQVAVRRRRQPRQHLAARRIGGAVGEAHTGAGDQRQRDRWDEIEQ